MRSAERISTILSLLFSLAAAGCGGGGATEENCTPNVYRECIDDAVYWFDSCHEMGPLVEVCGCGCHRYHPDECMPCNPPSKPSNPTPSDGELHVDRNLGDVYCDESTDPDPDPTGGDWTQFVTYDLYFGTTNPPPLIGADLMHPRCGVVSGNTPPCQPEAPGSRLEDNTTYFWKVVAKDTTGLTAEGDTWSFTAGGPSEHACPGTPSVTDLDGNVYYTVQIGSQCWTARNIRVGVTQQDRQYCSPTQPCSGGSSCMVEQCYGPYDDGIVERWCQDSGGTCENCGGYYRWLDAMNGSTYSGAQGICPDGWHVPTAADWDTLESNYPGNLVELQHFFGSSGFDMVPCGRMRDMTMNFEETEDTMYFWTSDSSGGEAYARTYYWQQNSSRSALNSGNFGYNVRCVKN